MIGFALHLRRLPLNTEHTSSDARLQVGEWEITPARHVVSRDGQEQALEPRLIQVLVHLAQKPGQVVTRAELLNAVWEDTVVQEEALTQAVSQLRRVFGDDPRQSRIIETIPKQGYRLIAPVTWHRDTEVSKPDQTETGRSHSQPTSATESAPWQRKQFWLTIVALTVVWLAWQQLGPDPGGDQGPPIVAEFLPARPLTSLPGTEAYPAVSPDGQLVVFAVRGEEESEFRLHLQRIGESEARPLTDEPGTEILPAWSPDGERLAFVRQNKDGRRVCIVAAIGGPVQEWGPPHRYFGGVDWSPDGTTIVYSWKDIQESPMRLMSLSLANGRTDTLTTPEQLARGDSYPRYSPDGSTLAFVRGDRGASRDVFLMPAAGGAAQKLTHGFYSCGGLDWAPDSESLVLSATLRGPFELWRVVADGGATSLLPTRGHRILHPSWASLGGPLVFVENTLNSGLMQLNLDTDQPAAVVAASTRLDMSARFSPSGEEIVFISERGGTRELWLSNADGSGARPLTDFSGNALRKPRWSPDGRRVAVNVARDGYLQIVVVDVATGLQRQATQGGGHYRLGHWSDEGDWLYYSRESGPIWQIGRVRWDGTDAVDENLDGCLSVHTQADAGIFYFKETAPGLYRRTDAGQEELVVTEANLHDQNNLQLSADGYWFIQAADQESWLAFYTFASQEVQRLRRLDGNPTGEFHLFADGQRLLYTTIVQSGSDLALVPELH